MPNATPRKDAEPHGRLDDVRDTASRAFDRTTAGLENNPLGILVGGIAVGALAGALIPRSAKEKELLAPVGEKIGATARNAVAAAKEAGKAELENRGLTPAAGKDQARALFDGVVKALTTAGTAAAKTTTGKTD